MVEDYNIRILAENLRDDSLKIVNNELQVVQTNERRVARELDIIALCEYVIRRQNLENKELGNEEINNSY